MSSSSQTPDPLDEFERITSSVTRISAFEALWNEAEEMLREVRPEGFDVLDVGRAAFDSLPESEKEEALDVLFYTFWAATLADRETHAKQAGGAS